jgi:hypothetical protein
MRVYRISPVWAGLAGAMALLVAWPYRIAWLLAAGVMLFGLAAWNLYAAWARGRRYFTIREMRRARHDNRIGE